MGLLSACLLWGQTHPGPHTVDAATAASDICILASMAALKDKAQHDHNSCPVSLPMALNAPCGKRSLRVYRESGQMLLTHQQLSRMVPGSFLYVNAENICFEIMKEKMRKHGITDTKIERKRLHSFIHFAICTHSVWMY